MHLPLFSNQQLASLRFRTIALHMIIYEYIIAEYQILSSSVHTGMWGNGLTQCTDQRYIFITHSNDDLTADIICDAVRRHTFDTSFPSSYQAIVHLYYHLYWYFIHELAPIYFFLSSSKCVDSYSLGCLEWRKPHIRPLILIPKRVYVRTMQQ